LEAHIGWSIRQFVAQGLVEQLDWLTLCPRGYSGVVESGDFAHLAVLHIMSGKRVFCYGHGEYAM